MTIKRIRPGAHFSTGTVHNGVLYVAGQTSDPEIEGIAAQTHDVLAKIDEILASANTDRSKLLMVNVYLPDIGHFAQMNEVYDAWVPRDTLPARATVESKLADDRLLIEITAIAALD